MATLQGPWRSFPRIPSVSLNRVHARSIHETNFSSAWLRRRGLRGVWPPSAKHSPPAMRARRILKTVPRNLAPRIFESPRCRRSSSERNMRLLLAGSSAGRLSSPHSWRSSCGPSLLCRPWGGAAPLRSSAKTRRLGRGRTSGKRSRRSAPETRNAAMTGQRLSFRGIPPLTSKESVFCVLAKIIRNIEAFRKCK